MPCFRSIVARGALVLGLGLIGVGCTGDGEEATPTPIVPTAGITLTASPSPSATGTPAVETVSATSTPPADSGPRRVGDPELDRIIEAVEDRDVVELSELVEYRVLGCTHELGAGGPPKCGPGQAEGEEVRVFPVVGCEGGWTTATVTLGRFAHEARGLYAAAEALPVGGAGPEWPEADTWLVFHEEGGAARLHVLDGRIVAAWYGCGAGVPADEMLRTGDATALILAGPWIEPVEVEGTLPRTDIDPVDGLLHAVAIYDLGVLHEAAVRAMNTLLPPVACEEALVEPGGIECDPSKGELDGDPVAVFPVAYCEGALYRQPDRPIAGFLDQVPVLHSVVEAPAESSESPLYLHGAYWLVYEFEAEPQQGSSAARLQVTEDGMLVSIWFGCQASAGELATWDGEPLPKIEVREE